MSFGFQIRGSAIFFNQSPVDFGKNDGGPVRGAAGAGSGAGSKHNLSNIHVKSLCPGDAGDGQNSGNRG
jgi:hypothetical protein